MLIKQHIIAITLLTLLVAVLYGQTLNHDFIWDDNDFIGHNVFIKNFAYIPDYFTPAYWKAWCQRYEIPTRYRPVRTLSFALDYYFWGLNPRGYHLTNIMLHAFNCILLYFFINVIIRFFNPDLKWLPLITALLFAVHPVNCETVAWIKNRSELLAFLFIFSSWFLFILNSRYKYISFFLFGLALCSKETALIFPVLLSYYCYNSPPSLKREGLNGLIRTIPFWLVTIPLIVLVMQDYGPSLDFRNKPYFEQVLIIMKSVSDYLRLLFYPVRLNVEHRFKNPDIFFIITILLFLCTCFLIPKLKKNQNFELISGGIIWTLLTILPGANHAFIRVRYIAEQRLYLPSVGFCMLTALALLKFSKKSPLILCILTGMLVLMYANITFTRTTAWKNSFSLLKAAVKDDPDNPEHHIGLACIYGNNGDLDWASYHFLKALELKPDSAMALSNMGTYYFNTNRLQKAFFYFKKAIQTDPNYNQAYTALGIAYFVQQPDKALEVFKKAASIKPPLLRAYLNLGIAYFKTSDLVMAVNIFQKAVQLDPFSPQAYHYLGVALYQKDPQKALQLMHKALALDPDYDKVKKSIDQKNFAPNYLGFKIL